MLSTEAGAGQFMTDDDDDDDVGLTVLGCLADILGKLPPACGREPVWPSGKALGW